MGWYEDSFRKLFFDFHTQSTATEVAKDFDAEAWADQLAKANVQAVSAIAKCLYGWKYYLKGSVGWPHPSLPLGLDVLGETLDACHKRCIRVIAYYHTFWSERLAATRPDWCERDALGRALVGREHAYKMCLLSPMLDEHMLPQVEEIAHNYEIDGMFFDFTYAYSACFCEHCKKRFREDTGLELPLDKNSPNWRIFVEWKLERFKEIRQKICDAVHRGRPDALVAFNWVYSTRQPERPPKDVGFLTLDIFPANQVFNGSMQSRYWATSGKPFDVMNSTHLQWWGDWGVKTAVSLQQECATIVANGGRTWIGYQMYPQFKVEPAVMGTLGDALAFIKERENLCKNAKPVPYIVVSHSIRSRLTHEPGFSVDETSLKGAHKVLLESGFHYNIITDEDLEEKIGQYRTVILPDQRYVSSGLAKALKGFVSEGGGLIATCLTGTEDEDLKPAGKFMLEDLFGVSLEGEYPHTHAYIELEDERLKPRALDMPILVWGKFVYAKPESAEVLARLLGAYLRDDGKYLLVSSPPGADTGYPAITLNRFGKGKVVYISGDVFSGYMRKNQWNIKHVVKNALNLVLPEKLVEIDGPNAIEVVLTKRGDERMVHLINHRGERTIGDNNALTEDIIPIHDIGVRVRCNRTPKDLRLEPEGKELKWKIKDGMVSVRVPKLNIHSCVVIK